MAKSNLTKQVAFLAKYFENRTTPIFKCIDGKFTSSNFAFWNILDYEPELAILNPHSLQQQFDDSEIITIIDSFFGLEKVVIRMWKTKNGQSLLLTEKWQNIEISNNKIRSYESVIKNVKYLN